MGLMRFPLLKQSRNVDDRSTDYESQWAIRGQPRQILERLSMGGL